MASEISSTKSRVLFGTKRPWQYGIRSLIVASTPARQNLNELS
jgi:hypothetical protein